MAVISLPSVLIDPQNIQQVDWMGSGPVVGPTVYVSDQNIPKPDWAYGSLVPNVAYVSPYFPTYRSVLNRGRNTGAGPLYVYWVSPNTVDTAGSFYPYAPAILWSQIVDVIYAATVVPGMTW